MNKLTSFHGLTCPNASTWKEGKLERKTTLIRHNWDTCWNETNTNKHAYFLLNVIYPRGSKCQLSADSTTKLDVDPQRDDDASPMSTYRCMSRPTWMLISALQHKSKYNSNSISNFFETRCRPSEGRRSIPDVIIEVHVETYLNIYG